MSVMVRANPHRGVVAAMLAVLACVTACSPSHDADPGAAAASTPEPATAAAPAPTNFSGDLRTLLLAVPAGSTRTVSPTGSDDDAVSIDDAASVFDDPDSGRRQLQAATFVQGAQREWIEADGTWIGIFLYQFGDAAKARDWSRGLQNGFRNNNLFGSCIAIDGIQDGCTFSRTSISTNGRWLSEAVFSRNDFTVEMFSTGPENIGTERLMNYAVAQFALLGSS